MLIHALWNEHKLCGVTRVDWNTLRDVSSINCGRLTTDPTIDQLIDIPTEYVCEYFVSL